MPTLAIGFGLALSALGPIGYFFAEGKGSPTAFIPTAFGVLLIVCGALAFDEKKLKHAMHGAATVGLLGFVLGAGRVGMVLAQGKPFGWAAQMVTTMSVLCAVFVGLCVKSFIDVRKAREKAQADG